MYTYNSHHQGIRLGEVVHDISPFSSPRLTAQVKFCIDNGCINVMPQKDPLSVFPYSGM